MANTALKYETASALLDALTLASDDGDDQTSPGVCLSTIHKAKGLEWKHVFVIGVMEGMLPIFHAKSLAELEEERRLLYVGITRAKDGLCLSYPCVSHDKAGYPHTTSISRLLQHIPSTVLPTFEFTDINNNSRGEYR